MAMSYNEAKKKVENKDFADIEELEKEVKACYNECIGKCHRMAELTSG